MLILQARAPVLTVPLGGSFGRDYVQTALVPVAGCLEVFANLSCPHGAKLPGMTIHRRGAKYKVTTHLHAQPG